MPTALRRLLIVALVLVTVGGLVVLGVRTVLDRVGRPFAQESRCTLGSTPYSLTTEQAANAATVTGVATARKLPGRAAVVALATALQESKLVNVHYGDRDSVGLFQQRPSQGWGSTGQILDPHYAAGRFYDRLVTVRDWQRRPVTEVAQAVQQSGYPGAYSQWEDQASVLARAFNGTVPAGVSCGFPEPTSAARPDRVVALLIRDLPATRLSAAGRTAELRPTAGWASAAWLVAHADRLGVQSVAWGGQRWSRADGWRPDAGPPDRLRFDMADVPVPTPSPVQ